MQRVVELQDVAAIFVVPAIMCAVLLLIVIVELWHFCPKKKDADDQKY